MLWLNVVLMVVCLGVMVVGVYQWKRSRRIRPIQMLACLVVFVMAAVATVKGVSIDELRREIESGSAPSGASGE